MGMAFFSLSIGMGSLMIYGSYLSNSSSITQVATIVAFADTLVAILAGIIIFPIVFTYNLDPSTAGPGLIFQTLPVAFGSMPGGEIFAIFFFILLFFAAITSSISLIEPAVTLLIENYSYTRAEASLKGGIITWLIGLGTIWSFNYGQDYTFFGMTFFGILDAFTSKILLPLGGLMMAIFVGYIVKKNTTSKELNLDNGLFLVWRFLIRFLAPIAVTFIFVNGFIT
jgi:NSS family neurotransmitter:Na+ symporter